MPMRIVSRHTTVIFKNAIDTAEAEGKVEGYQEGHVDGEQKGRLEGRLEEKGK
ncbi:MAG: hypothetical protein R2865_02645 [Deinococcales bacterium]